jgi:UDPglucose 6-dehydrogenase
MRIGVIGFGYVGSAVASGFREKGHSVSIYDIDEKILKKAKIKKYKTYKKLGNLVSNSDIIFVCVPTPPNKDGSNNSIIVRNVVVKVADLCNKETILVIKSTIVPGTTDKFIDLIKTKKKPLRILFNPEFLTTKEAYEDFLNPDRIVIGGHDKKAINILCHLYKSFSKTILVVDPNTAELAKYASNFFLATKVSFTNQIRFICERVRADPVKVMEIVGLDKRIGPSHLDPTRTPAGFGGGCLPKDLDALIFQTSKAGIDNRLLKAVKEINEVVESRPTNRKKH